MVEANAKVSSCEAIGCETTTDKVDQDEEGTREDPLTPAAIILIFLITVIPNIIVAVALSAIGYGARVYDSTASGTSNLMGDGTALLSVFFFFAIYVFDYSTMSWCMRALLTTIQALLLLAASVLKSRKYPWTPVLFSLLLIPFLLGHIRFTICKLTARREFYRAVSAATILSAIGLFVAYFLWATSSNRLWGTETKDWLALSVPKVYENAYSKHGLNYTTHCKHGVDLVVLNLTKLERDDIQTACTAAATVWWMAYVCPIWVACSNLVVAAFCFVQVRMSLSGNRPMRIIQSVIVGLGSLCMCLYFANVVTGSSLQMSSALMGFYGAAICALIVWAHLEIGIERLQEFTKQSFMAGMLVQAWSSNWGRAFAVFALGVFIPVFFALTMVNQSVRRLRRISDSTDKYTDLGRKIANEMATWDWCAILARVCIVGELFFIFNVGFTRVTYIFLSWLNEAISNWSLAAVNLLIVGVGFLMFLLPPVPGASVYLFAGLVLGRAGESSLGFPLSILIGSITCTITKILGCMGQYMIGYNLGKSVKVQQMIAVDSIQTRAIEQQLKTRGLSLGKVAVLVGGPDWPVSVACGIMRVNIPQMILGTLPIFFCAAPIVAAGSFMTKAGSDDGSGGMYSLLGAVAMGLSLAVNGGFSFFAVQQTLVVIQRHRDELAEPREEHRAVEELTKKEEAWRQCYERVTKWVAISCCRKGNIIAAAALHVMCPAIFVLLSESCFRPFSLGGGRIEDDYSLGGLDNKPLSIVKPMGACAIGLFGLAVLLHIVHIYDFKFATNRAFTQQSAVE